MKIPYDNNSALRPLRRRSHPRHKRGAVIVEMAIAVSFLMIFLFGTIQICMLFQDQTSLANIARVTARCLSLGDSVALAKTTAKNSSQWTIEKFNNITWTFQYSLDGGQNWTNMTTTGATAPTNSLVQVKTSYVHQFETKVLGGGSITLNKNVVYHHE